MNAGLAAIITAASAVLGDFRRADDDYLDHGAARPDYSPWAHRLAAMLGAVLDGAGQAPALDGAQLVTLGHALADAVYYRDPQGICADCDNSPSCLCEDHADDLDKTDAYLQLARALGIEVER